MRVIKSWRKWCNTVHNSLDITANITMYWISATMANMRDLMSAPCFQYERILIALHDILCIWTLGTLMIFEICLNLVTFKFLDNSSTHSAHVYLNAVTKWYPVMIIKLVCTHRVTDHCLLVVT